MTNIKIDKIIRSRRRTLALVITKDGELLVRSPIRTTLYTIQQFINEKQSWIEKKQQQVRETLLLTKPKCFISGEEYYFLGQIYLLRVYDGDEINISDSLYFPRQLLAEAEQHLITWFKKMAWQKLAERIAWYSSVTGIKYRSVKISNAETRWGSCSHTGAINFSWKLIMAPVAVIDYVVVHELMHIVEPNHSRKFWGKVKAFMPDYQTAKIWLKQNGAKLQIVGAVNDR